MACSVVSRRSVNQDFPQFSSVFMRKLLVIRQIGILKNGSGGLRFDRPVEWSETRK